MDRLGDLLPQHRVIEFGHGMKIVWIITRRLSLVIHMVELISGGGKKLLQKYTIIYIEFLENSVCL